MHNLLIADDETNIRVGLRAMIEREFPGMYRFLFAADGEEALELISREPVAILITDIRMPVMDGMALLQRLQELPEKPEVLILSGYDDFQYAKEAIRYEVREYLLKPIVREELSQALRRIDRHLAERRELAHQAEASRQVLDELRVSQLQMLFLDREGSGEEAEAICSRLDLQAFEPGYCVGLIKVDGMQTGRLATNKAMRELEMLLDRCRDESRCAMIRFLNHERRLVVLASGKAALNLAGEELARRRPELQAVIGLSEPGKGFAHLRDAYRQAAEALKYALLLPQAATIEYVAIKGKTSAEELPLEPIRKLANMLGTDRTAEMKALLQEVLDPKRLISCPISHVEAISARLNELVFDQAFHQYGEALIEVLKMYREAGNIFNFAALQDYYHAVENLLLTLNDYVRQVRSVHAGHPEMKRAVDFIRDQCQRDLNMAMVSNHVSLNYSYFSQAFKEFTGESFNSYLKRVRIERAKELLQSTDHLVYEISERVGFKNPKHFNRAFREVEGISPQEFRQKQR